MTLLSTASTATVELPVAAMAKHLTAKYASYMWIVDSAVRRGVDPDRSATVREVRVRFESACGAFGVVLGHTQHAVGTAVCDAASHAGDLPDELAPYGKDRWFSAAHAHLTRALYALATDA
jgi:hypothetical protein